MASNSPSQNPSLLPVIGPDGLAQEAPVIAYTEKIIAEEQVQLRKYIEENYSKIRDVERELASLNMEMKLTSGPKKAALEHMRKKIEISTERIRVAKQKEEQARKAWEEASQAVKNEEEMKQKLCEDLNQLVQESSNTQLARLEGLKRRMEALNPGRASSASVPHDGNSAGCTQSAMDASDLATNHSTESEAPKKRAVHDTFVEDMVRREEGLRAQVELLNVDPSEGCNNAESNGATTDESDTEDDRVNLFDQKFGGYGHAMRQRETVPEDARWVAAFQVAIREYDETTYDEAEHGEAVYDEYDEPVYEVEYAKTVYDEVVYDNAESDKTEHEEAECDEAVHEEAEDDEKKFESVPTEGNGTNVASVKKKSQTHGRGRGIGAVPKGRAPGWTGAGFDS